MDRAEAIEIVDRTHHQFRESLRIERCPACEAFMVIEEVEESEVPPERLAVKHRAEEYLEKKANMNIRWKIPHLKDCSFAYYWRDLPRFCQVMNIRTELVTILIPKPNDNPWVETVEVRVPDPGDPPVSN